MMVKCEMSHMDGTGKIHLFEYLFAAPASGHMSNFNRYTVIYDSVLQIHRVFEDRHQGVEPKVELWEECVRSRRGRETVSSSHIAFPFLSWPVPAPAPKITKSLTAEGTNSSSSEENGTNTPITPVTPSPECSLPQVDVCNAEPSITTSALDRMSYKSNGEPPMDPIEASSTPENLNQSNGGPLKRVAMRRICVTINFKVQARHRYLDVHTSRAVQKGLPGPSPLRICWSNNAPAGGLQQTVSMGRLPRKTPPQNVAHPFDRVVRESNEECKSFQTKSSTPGHLSRYIRAGSEAEIDQVWFASELSQQSRGFTEANDLAEALWRWRQMSLKTKDLRMFGAFVAPRLSGEDGDIEERSAWYHTTGEMDSGIRKEATRAIDLDHIPFTEPLREDRGAECEVREPHHWNLQGQPVYCKTYTPPEVSLWASYRGSKRYFRMESREGVTVSQAWKLVDPYSYRGPPELLSERGAKLREVVIGLVDKVYAPCGTWVYDDYNFDETVPRSSEEIWESDGRVGPNPQMPKQSHTLGSQESDAVGPLDPTTVSRDNDDFYNPGSNVEDQSRSLESLDLALGNKPLPESLNLEPRNQSRHVYEEPTTSDTTAGPRSPNLAEQSVPECADQELASEVIDEQSGPGRQTTASAVVGAQNDRSYSDDLDLSFAEEDLVESTPRSQGRSSVAPDPGISPTPIRRLPFDNGAADALTALLANGGPDEEVNSCLARALQRSPPTSHPYVHNSEDEDSIDYTNTWKKRNQLPTTPNPKLARFMETSTKGKARANTSKRVQTDANKALEQAAEEDFLFGSQPLTLSGEMRQESTTASTPPSASYSSEIDTDEPVDRTASSESVEVTTTAPEMHHPSAPSQDLLDSRQYDSDAAKISIPEGFGTAATTDANTSSPQASSYEDRAEELIRSSSNLKALSSADLYKTLRRIDEIIRGYTERSTPSKAPAPRSYVLQTKNKAVAEDTPGDEDSSTTRPAENTENTPGALAELNGTADSDNASEWSEPQVADGWLEYMAERGALQNATGDEDPIPANREVRVAADDSPIEDESSQSDPSWLDYQEARGVADAFLNDTMRREEAERAADEALKRRQALSEQVLLDWLKEGAVIEAQEQGDIQRERQIRAATTAALAHYSDVSEIPSPTAPTFSEYYFGAWAFSLGAVVRRLPFVLPC